MKVGELSGGERNRVHMAKLVKSGANVLILDEPTNDLDVDTLRSLERRLRLSAVSRLLLVTTAGFSTELRRISSPLRAILMSNGSRGTLPTTKQTEEAARRRGSTSSCEVSSPRGYVGLDEAGTWTNLSAPRFFYRLARRERSFQCLCNTSVQLPTWLIDS